MKIFKYPIPVEAPGSFSIEMPSGAAVMCAGWQGNSVGLYALVDPEGEMTTREFLLEWTGITLPGDLGRYIVTFSTDDGFVWHLFEKD